MNSQQLKELSFLRGIVEEQLNTIKALNSCINGPESTTTENIRLVDRLETENEDLRIDNHILQEQVDGLRAGYDRVAKELGLEDEPRAKWFVLEIHHIKQNLETMTVAVRKWLADNDVEGFGCACEPNHMCGPCREAQRQRPLYEALQKVTRDE